MSLEISELTFCGNNPGATKYGNFINYYSFHSCTERIKNLSPEIFSFFKHEETLICLDIGCNTGELTSALKIYLQNLYPSSKIKILALDIDPTLIKRAKESNTDTDLLFMDGDVLTDAGCENMRAFLNDHQKVVFDIIFCFSVSMWIHINNGDEGLIKFLELITKNSKMIVIEPQPWKCYKNAQRRMKRSGQNFKHYDKLKFREDVNLVIEKMLNESHSKFYESPTSSWKRKITCFTIKRSYDQFIF